MMSTGVIQREPASTGNKIALDSSDVNREIEVTSVEPPSVLVDQLQELWRQEKDNQTSHREAGNMQPSLQASLQKIGSREKDQLLLHLLEQQDALRTQRSEVAALGEKIAAQLLQQQVRQHCSLASPYMLTELPPA